MTALAARDMKVSLLVRSKAIFSQLADPYTASLAEKVLRTHGIRTIKDIEVSGIASRSRSDQPAAPLVVHTWPMPRGRALECLRQSRHTELVISTRRDCSGWEDRVARGENLCADTLGLKQARGPRDLF